MLDENILCIFIIQFWKRAKNKVSELYQQKICRYIIATKYDISLIEKSCYQFLCKQQDLDIENLSMTIIL